MFMDGSEACDFTVHVVPGIVNALLEKAGLGLDQINLFVFHLSNAYMFGELRRIPRIPRENFKLRSITVRIRFFRLFQLH
jgi:3-oxoacyl-[acyl-carrier-protein] synthase-3